MELSQYAHFDFNDESGTPLWPSVLVKIKQAVAENGVEDYSQLSASIRKIADDLSETSKGARAFLHVLADLIDFQISFELSDSGIWLKKNQVSREVVVSQLLARRNESLDNDNIKEFLRFCEGCQFSKNTQNKSIRNLFHDGVALSKKIDDFKKGEITIEKVIKPFIQVVEGDVRDKFTNLKLTDVWRYCRLTWSLEHQSVPGRQMCFLVRNKAEKNNPIIGIGALASPVLQHELRDDWIGWSLDSIISDILAKKRDIRWFIGKLEKIIEYSIKNLFFEDFELSENDISKPTYRVWNALLHIAEEAKTEREELLKDTEKKAQYRKTPKPQDLTDHQIQEHARNNPLWRRKRAEKLAKLLQARALIIEAKKFNVSYEVASLLFHSDKNKALINFTLGEIRTLATASRIADLNVCGAIPPYNHLLGGKLIALAAVSSEIQNLYKKRYGATASAISSFMAGKKIYQPTNLEVITTTSLYGKHTVQYNGLKLTKSKYHNLKHDVEWKKLGVTKGKGTFHISNKTSKILNEFNSSYSAEGDESFQHINYLFGEGTSPKLRIIRQALSALGYNPDYVLKHNQERLFLATSLGKGSKERLLDFNLKGTSRRNNFSELTNAWFSKWVLKRLDRTELKEKLSSENFEKLASSLRPQSYDEEYKRL